MSSTLEITVKRRYENVIQIKTGDVTYELICREPGHLVMTLLSFDRSMSIIPAGQNIIGLKTHERLTE